MNTRAHPAQRQPKPRSSTALKRTAYILATTALFVAGLVYTNHLATSERSKTLVAWGDFLKDTAGGNSKKVSDWVNHQYVVLNELASNLSLQIYMTELALGDKAAGENKADTGYLGLLLKATAEREGFDKGGLVLLDMDNKVIAATSNLLHPEERLINFAIKSPTKPQLIGPYVNGKGVMVVAFKTPVFVVQGDNLPSQLIGTVLGVREVQPGLYPLLNNTKTQDATLEPFLVQEAEHTVEYYLPDLTTPAPQPLYFPRNRDDLAAIYAMGNPGTVATKLNRDADNVLVTAEKVKDTPWFLVQQVAYAEAMRTPTTLQTIYNIVYCAVFAVLALAGIAFAASAQKRKFAQAALSYGKNLEALASQKKALDNILDAMPLAVTFSGADGSTYANQNAHHIHADHALVELNKYYREHWKGYVEDTPLTSYSLQGASVIKCHYVPIKTDTPGILTLEEDVTDSFTETHVEQQVLRLALLIAETRIRCLKRSKPGMFEVDGQELEEAYIKQLLWTD